MRRHHLSAAAGKSFALYGKKCSARFETSCAAASPIKCSAAHRLQREQGGMNGTVYIRRVQFAQ